jgi:predicted HNH restriction endonuclease
MSLISEKDLILPALSVMRRNGGSIKMTKLISSLRSELQPKGADLAILDGRQDDHFSQKVRNLVSHRTLVKKGYAKYTKGKEGSGVLTITAKGMKHLEDAMGTSTLPAPSLDNEHMLAAEGHRMLRTANPAARSEALRKMALKIHGSSCAACGLDFHYRYKALARDCIELHHVVPVSSGIRKSTIKDLVPLCPNCHRVAHTEHPPLPVSAVRRMLRPY